MDHFITNQLAKTQGRTPPPPYRKLYNKKPTTH